MKKRNIVSTKQDEDSPLKQLFNNLATQRRWDKPRREMWCSSKKISMITDFSSARSIARTTDISTSSSETKVIVVDEGAVTKVRKQHDIKEVE